MFRSYALRSVEIRNRARDFQNAVVRAGTEAHLADGQLQGAFSGVVESAEATQRASGDVGIVIAALLLNRAGGLDASAHFGGCYAAVAAAEFFVGHGGHFDVQVDAVEKRPAHLAQVPLDDGAGTAAFPGGVGVESAGTPVQIAVVLFKE